MTCNRFGLIVTHRAWVLPLALNLLTACGAQPVEKLVESVPNPARIVSLTPAATEILFGLGVFDRVVGISDYCTYPPQVDTLPRLGSWQDADLERLTRLAPDLVVTGGVESSILSGQLAALEIPTVTIAVDTLDDVFRNIERIGLVVGRSDRARALAEETQAELGDIRADVQGVDRPRVLVVVDRVPGTLRSIYTVSEDSFLAGLIQIAGGEPVRVTNAVAGYAQVSLEALVYLDPGIIIDMIQGVPGRFRENSMEVWRQIPNLRAVQTGRVHPIRDTSVLHPSQRVSVTARRFAEIIHPEVFQQ